MITKNAIRLINVISAEYMTHVRRAEAEYIPAGKIQACTIGGLTAKSRRDVDLKTFLETIAFIPEDEDTRDDVDWAEDRRAPHDHVVNTRMIKPENVRPDPDEIHEHPLPGTRIC